MKRGKVPSLISAANGGIVFEQVKRAGPCFKCGITLVSDEWVGLLKHKVGGFTNSKRTCLDCVKRVIEQTEKDFDEIKNNLQAAQKHTI